MITLKIDNFVILTFVTSMLLIYCYIYGLFFVFLALCFERCLIQDIDLDTGRDYSSPHFKLLYKGAELPSLHPLSSNY